jgi:O-antigen/teichoic acid export membrane protein
MSDSPSITIAAKIREVWTHSLIYGLGSIAQSAVQFLLIPVLTTALATAQVGAYSLLQMAAVIAGSIFYLGLTSALPRSYFDYDDQADRRSVFTTAFILLCVGALAQITLGAVAGGWISRLLLHSDAYRAHVFWALLGSALSFINYFFFTYLRFLRRSFDSILLSVITLAGSIGLSIYLLRLHPQDLTAPFKGVAYAQLAVAFIFILIHGREAFTAKLNSREVVILLRFGVPTVLTSIAAMAIDWGDRILIDRILSVREVGIYSVGYRLGSIVNVLVITPFIQIWNPMMMEYRTHENISEFFSRMVSYYFLASSVVVIGVCFFVRDLLPAIARSADYARAAPIVILVMTGYLLYGASNILGAGVIYERRIIRFALVYYFVAVAKFALNLFLIPRFGINGAAIATLLMYGLIPMLVYWQSRSYFPISFETWRLSRVTLIVSACLFFGLVVDTHFAVPILLKGVLCMLALGGLLLVCTDDTEKRHLGSLLLRRRTLRVA